MSKISQDIIRDVSSQITNNVENANDLLTKYDKELISFINRNSDYTTNLLRKIKLSLENLDELSKIPNIQTKLNKILNLKNVKKIKSTILDNSDNSNIKKLFEIIDNKEVEPLLQKLEEEDAKAKSQSTTTSKQVVEKATSHQVAEENATSEQEEKQADTNTLFEAKLKEMEEKLPPKLVNNENKGNNLLSYKDTSDKEFCYKFLYCWLNNSDNQTNPNAIKVCNSIIDTYGIEDERFPKLDEKEDITIKEITFDVGFIINIKTTKEGGTPTQKRRPNKPNKRNHTIKDRVRVKTR